MTAQWNTAVRELYARLGITLLRSSGSEAPARCFASPDAHRHEDRHPSVSVNLVTGAWFCHGCGARGGAYDAARLRGHTPRSAMDLLFGHGLAESRGPESRRDGPPSTPRPAARAMDQLACTREVIEAQLTAWHHQLVVRRDLVERLALERLISAAALDRFEIGLDGRRITIPVRAADGTSCGVLRWLPFGRGRAPKMLAVPGTRRDLFPPPEQLSEGRVLICEGEPDALAAHSAGIAAVAIPGVASWRSEWAPRLAGRDVLIVLDCDREGRACAARIARDLTAAGITSRVLDLGPDCTDGYDLTDYLLAGGSIDVLRR